MYRRPSTTTLQAPRARPAAAPHTPARGPCERDSRTPDRTAPGNHRPITRARACTLDGEGEELIVRASRQKKNRKITNTGDSQSARRTQNVHEEDVPGAQGQGGAQAAAHQGACRSASDLRYAVRSLCLSPCVAHLLASPSRAPFPSVCGAARQAQPQQQAVRQHDQCASTIAMFARARLRRHALEALGFMCRALRLVVLSLQAVSHDSCGRMCSSRDSRWARRTAV